MDKTYWFTEHISCGSSINYQAKNYKEPNILVLTDEEREALKLYKIMWIPYQKSTSKSYW